MLESELSYMTRLAADIPAAVANTEMKPLQLKTERWLLSKTAARLGLSGPSNPPILPQEFFVMKFHFERSTTRLVPTDGPLHQYFQLDRGKRCF